MTTPSDPTVVTQTGTSGQASTSGRPSPAAPAPRSSGPSPLTGQPDAINAAQDALRAEHAAVWCLTLITAFLTPALDQRAVDDVTAHRTRRAGLESLLTDAGVQPVSALPAYRTPMPVTDQSSAVQLAIVAESDTSAAWRVLLERSSDANLRTAALGALTDSTVRGFRWRATGGVAPAVPDFPGRQ